MRRRNILFFSAALVASVAASLPAAVPASANHRTLFALEIFAPEPGGVPAPGCAVNGGVQRAPSADLPAGTVRVAVIQGSLVGGAASADDCPFRVNIGARSILVYSSADTRIDKVPLLGSGVRVIAARDEQTGVLVAERVVGRQTARNEIERAFTATVDVDQTGADEWLVTETGGTARQFTFDVATAPADIEPGLGDTVTIEFSRVAPPPD
jgi:hypothetical protein